LIKLLKILSRFISSFHSIIDDYQKTRIIALLIEEYSIIQIIVENVSSYHLSLVKDRKMLIKEIEADSILFVSGCSHNDYTTEIFSFFNLITANQHNMIFDEITIESLYKVFVENPFTKKEINLFFMWLKEADDKKLVPRDSYQKIFNKMVLSDKIEFANISIDFYNTIWNIFVSINYNLDKIDVNKVRNYSFRLKIIT